ncbi:dimethyl sulfoxide reductase anchor subunit family protein [Azospirillum brasilense]|uniref:Dimethyl sulfoxide reductase anchor subunit n=1 Tax=Azospirillum brasilense TaxID=192 RepID=A0A6L3AWD8_AZOBR|nr:DmsC/YnfH family molybdoenzyme membrane anchor subunit [Azospirillum brasilense]KAA0681230.1 dimethyl sulfoxide reductase anchor subunit [Azospirillum brasilense]
MHPAFSIIFFTSAAGAGYGLLALLGLLAPFGLLPASPLFGLAALALALGLVVAGLLSSLAHLGRPERAWRALSQWRSSWLSREGVAAVATFLPAGVFAIAWIVLTAGNDGSGSGVAGVAGWITAVMAAVTVYCTAMIYASLKPIRQWANPWVPRAYLALSLMTGALLLNALLGAAGQAAGWSSLLALASVGLAWAAKEGHWRHCATARPVSTAETATGLGHIGRVRLLDAPHSEDNYLLKEMGFRVGRRHAVRLRLITRLAAFALPAALSLGALVAGPGALSGTLALLAAVAAALGVIAERWLFFAEAKHTVTLFYGAGEA